MKWIFLAVILVVWLIAVWTMLRMFAEGWNAGERNLLRFFGGGVVLASYNRKNLKTFAKCVAVMIVAGIVFNVLVFTGLATP